MSKRLIFVRHGETPHNIEGRLMGWSSDVGLTDKGREDAATTAAKLKEYQIDHMYVSDLRRARESGEIISQILNMKPTLTHGLRERNLGIFAEKTWAELKTNHAEHFTKFLDHHDPNWNGLEGESLQDMHQRFDQFLASLKASHPNQTILMITHSGFLYTILRDYFGFFATESFLEVEHTSVTILDKTKDSYHLTLFNG